LHMFVIGIAVVGIPRFSRDPPVAFRCRCSPLPLVGRRQLPKSMYEPEQFPGLIHRMPDPKTVILLFASGKLVCTGAKKEGDVYRAVTNLHVMLEQ